MNLVVRHTPIFGVCRGDRRRVQGAKHSQGGPLTSICNAAIAFERPAEAENWGVMDH